MTDSGVFLRVPLLIILLFIFEIANLLLQVIFSVIDRYRVVVLLAPMPWLDTLMQTSLVHDLHIGQRARVQVCKCVT